MDDNYVGPDPEAFEPEEDDEGWEFDGQHHALIQADRFVYGCDHTRWLVENLLQQNSLAMVFGPPGSGKSFFAIDLSLRVSSCKMGDQYCGRSLDYPDCALYVAGEDGPGVRDRVDGWIEYHDPKRSGMNNRGHFIWDTRVAPINLLDAQSVDQFIGAITQKYWWGLIVIDTLARCFGGGDENSTRDMNIAVASLEKIKNATGACVLVIHHTGKGDPSTARGSNAMRGALDTEIRLTPRGRGFRVSCTKQRGGEKFEPFDLDLHPQQVTRDIACRVHEINTAVVVPPTPQASSDKKPKGALTKNRRLVLETIGEMQPEGADRGAIETTDLNTKLHVKLAKSSASDAVEWLVENGYLARISDSEIEAAPGVDLAEICSKKPPN